MSSKIGFTNPYYPYFVFIYIYINIIALIRFILHYLNYQKNERMISLFYDPNHDNYT